jgi:hypothetical protein
MGKDYERQDKEREKGSNVKLEKGKGMGKQGWKMNMGERRKCKDTKGISK